MRGAFRLARLALHLLWGVATVALLFPWIAPGRRLGLKRRWSRQLLSVLGIRLAADRHAPVPAGMVVANHISWLDIFVINAVAPCAFVSKDEVRAWPVIGWLSAKTDTIFLERGSRRAAHRATEHVEECLRRGQRVAIFPEGTTSDGRQLLPFHSALIQPAVDAGCVLLPVALSYLDEQGRPSMAAAYVGDTSLGQSLLAIAMASRITARPAFLPAVSAADSDRRHLSATLHRHISHGLVSRER